MQSWLKTFVSPTERATRLDERASEQSFVLAHWHPSRTMSGALGQPIR